MGRTQDLQEQYEDALFSLMMEQVAEEEGRKAAALNQQLQDDPAAAVPASVRQRCEQTIRKAFSARKRKKVRRTLCKVMKTVVLVVLVLWVTLTISFAAVPNFKARVLNTVLNVIETHTDFTLAELRKQPVPPELQVDPGWIPEGFELVDDDSIRDGAWKSYRHPDSGATLRIEKFYPADVSVDTEDAEIENIEIQGYPAKLITKNHEVSIIWLNSDCNVVYLIFTEWVPVEDALKFAENIP